MRKYGRFYSTGGTVVGAYRLTEASGLADKLGVGALLLGLYDTECILGSSWNDLVELGRAAPHRAYPVHNAVEEVSGFWDRYLAVGRCAADPRHLDARLADRFVADQTKRVCKWCGYCRRRILTPRMVFDESWAP